jgi:hypothetical protein
MTDMAEQNRRFELLYTGHHLFNPEGTYQTYRSDDMIGSGGRVLVSGVFTGSKTEVPYSALSRAAWRDVVLDGVAVVRICRTLNGDILGEWPASVSARDAITPVPAAQGEELRPEASTSDSGAPASGDALAGALRAAGDLLSKSQSSGWRSLGSLLSNLSQGADVRAGAPQHTQSAVPPAPAGEPPPLITRAERPRLVEPEAVREMPAPLAASPLPIAPIPLERRCTACAHYRPYVRISERFTQELGPGTADDTVARALNDLISQEDRGKGEEAKLLADLYKRGANRWGARAPSFFRYCAALERDPEEPTYFIAQIRNPDARCQPVRRTDGRRFNQSATDFAPRDAEAHSCSTCRHRIKAAGPGEDAKEIREIVAGASYAAALSAAVSKSGGGGDASLLSSFPEAKRRNAAAARAREMAESFARRGDVNSHLSTEPRYLERCGLKSDPIANRFRVCAVENPNDMCPEWARVTPTEAQSPPRR